MTKTVIFDIDGTLADCTHRLHHVTGLRKNWEKFFEGIPQDPPVIEIVQLSKDMEFSGYSVICCSGRGEEYRDTTEEWLRRHDVPFERLYMRPAKDYRPDHIIKAELLQKIKDDGFDPWLVVDDRQSVVDMWREKGLVVLQCKPNEPHTYPETAVLNLMVGPSGAGKSTWLLKAGPRFGIRLDQVVSSDLTREDIAGDFKDQSKNDQVWAAIHATVKTRLRHGLPTTVDATNIRRKDRVALATLCPVPVRYFVIDRPLEEKRATAGWRADVMVGDKPLIDKHDEVFRANYNDIMNGDGLDNVTVYLQEMIIAS